METAKELAFKAYCHNNMDLMSGNPNDREERIKIQFENWWSRFYTGDNYQSGMNHKHNVYVDGKRYIQAE